jgi:hypothetical protein
MHVQHVMSILEQHRERARRANATASPTSLGQWRENVDEPVSQLSEEHLECGR